MRIRKKLSLGFLLAGMFLLGGCSIGKKTVLTYDGTFELELGHLSMIFDAKWQNFCVRKNTYANVGHSTRFLTDKPAVMMFLP